MCINFKSVRHNIYKIISLVDIKQITHQWLYHIQVNQITKKKFNSLQPRHVCIKHIVGRSNTGKITARTKKRSTYSFQNIKSFKKILFQVQLPVLGFVRLIHHLKYQKYTRSLCFFSNRNQYWSFGERRCQTNTTIKQCYRQSIWLGQLIFNNTIFDNCRHYDVLKTNRAISLQNSCFFLNIRLKDTVTGERITAIWFNNIISLATSYGVYSLCWQVWKQQSIFLLLCPSKKIKITFLNSICKRFIPETKKIAHRLEYNFNRHRLIYDDLQMPQSVTSIRKLSSKYNRGAKLMLLRGRRGIVRGTVKNACDHPNGGRTRSLSRPQTPWGAVMNTSRSCV